MPRGKKKQEEVVETKASDDKELDLTIAQIEKQFGPGSIMSVKNYKDTSPAKHISTGSLNLDVILGKGGLTFGRTVELYGPEGAGKTTLTLTLMARAQELGLRCALIDMEHALDPQYAENLGVDLGKMYISQPDHGEEGLSIAETLIRSGKFDIVIFDSIAAINPAKDLEKDFVDNAKMAGRASLLTRFFERNNSPIQKNEVLFIVTNQLRANLSPYGAPTQTSGGWALKHSASQRLEIRPVEKLQDNSGEIYGNKVRVKVTKNRLNAPYKEAKFDIVFGHGIDRIADIVEVASAVGVVEKAGAWYNYGDTKFQGMKQIREKLSENPDLLEEIRVKTVEIVGPEWGKEGK